MAKLSGLVPDEETPVIVSVLFEPLLEIGMTSSKISSFWGAFPKSTDWVTKSPGSETPSQWGTRQVVQPHAGRESRGSSIDANLNDGNGGSVRTAVLNDGGDVEFIVQAFADFQDIPVLHEAEDGSADVVDIAF